MIPLPDRPKSLTTSTLVLDTLPSLDRQTDGQTDRQTDGRTDGGTDGRTELL